MKSIPFQSSGVKGFSSISSNSRAVVGQNFFQRIPAWAFAVAVGLSPLGAADSRAAQFDVKNESCVAKTWNGSAWVPVASSDLEGKEIARVAPSTSGATTRFKVDSTWYSTAKQCVQTDERAPASLEAQSESDQRQSKKKEEPGRGGFVLRGAMEFANFSRTLGFGGRDYKVSLSTVAFKAGVGKQSFFHSSNLFWGWNLDGFFGVSSVTAETASPVTYSGSGVLTVGSRGTGAIGYQISKRIQSQLDLGVGMSYASLSATNIAAATDPKALSVFPVAKLGLAYQLGTSFGIGAEAISQGVMRDFAFSGGVLWSL